MPPLEEFSGVYKGTRWVSPDKDFVIGFLECGTTVKGPCEPGELVANLPYRFFGKWETSPKYGKGFSFATFTKDLPHGREAVVQYLLRQLKDHKTGIGHTKAHRLYDHFSSDAVRKLRMEPLVVAKAINISEDQASRASQALEADAKIENTKIELIGILAGKGFPKTIFPELIERWGARAPSMIKRDAFLLLTKGFPGAGFSRVDNLYLSLGGDPAKLKRQTLCAWHHLTQTGHGDTWHPIEEAEVGIRAKVDGVNVRPVKAVKLGIRSEVLAIYREPDGKKWLTDFNHAKNEANVARLISKFQTAKTEWPEIIPGLLSSHQDEQLSAAISSPIGILAGTPGTGKSYAAAALIRSIIKEHGAGSVEVVAPTGKAAVRLTEVMNRYELNLQGKTIHRLLQPGGNGHGTGDWGFRFNESNPLGVPYLVVDECSMIETDLMAFLLRACTVGTHILFVGDPFQLPPVGHGAPFRDMLAMPHHFIPRGELTELRRNEGLIVEACSRIKSGQPFTPAPQFGDKESGINLRVINVGSPAALINQIKGLYESLTAQGKRDPIEDVQILCALNEKSEAGRKKLNPFLQSLLNPKGERSSTNKFREGDKIICLTNGMYPSHVSTKAPPLAIFNGELGRVTSVEDPTATEMLFPDVGDGARRIRIPTKGEWSDSFDLAYAITCHKSQGSEWPVVVIITDDAADRVCSREWHYTAISRAKERCIIFGRMATIGRQCRRVILGQRKTFLKELLMEQFQENTTMNGRNGNDSTPQGHGGSSRWLQPQPEPVEESILI